MKEYNCLELLYFLWTDICSLNEFISLTVNKYIISLRLNKYNSLKLHNYTVAGCKILPWVQIYFVECEYMISWFLRYLQTANHSQLWMVTQTNINYDLLVLCIPCEQRPLCKPRKAETSCIPTKNVYVSPRHLRHYHWNLLFHQKPQIGVVVCADVSENILPETKNNFSGIDILTCPSLSSHVLLLQVIYMLSCNTSPQTSLSEVKTDDVKTIAFSTHMIFFIQQRS